MQAHRAVADSRGDRACPAPFANRSEDPCSKIATRDTRERDTHRHDGNDASRRVMLVRPVNQKRLRAAVRRGMYVRWCSSKNSLNSVCKPDLTSYHRDWLIRRCRSTAGATIHRTRWLWLAARERFEHWVAWRSTLARHARRYQQRERLPRRPSGHAPSPVLRAADCRPTDRLPAHWAAHRASALVLWHSARRGLDHSAMVLHGLHTFLRSSALHASRQVLRTPRFGRSLFGFGGDHPACSAGQTGTVPDDSFRVMYSALHGPCMRIPRT